MQKNRSTSSKEIRENKEKINWKKIYSNKIKLIYALKMQIHKQKAHVYLFKWGKV